MATSDAIKHFEGLQKRYTAQHNGTACEHVGLALEGLRRMAEGPEVVRCGECRSAILTTKLRPIKTEYLTCCKMWQHVSAEGGCSYGQRKEGEHGGVD